MWRESLIKQSEGYELYMPLLGGEISGIRVTPERHEELKEKNTRGIINIKVNLRGKCNKTTEEAHKGDKQDDCRTG